MHDSLHAYLKVRDRWGKENDLKADISIDRLWDGAGHMSHLDI